MRFPKFAQTRWYFRFVAKTDLFEMIREDPKQNLWDGGMLLVAFNGIVNDQAIACSKGARLCQVHPDSMKHSVLWIGNSGYFQ